MIDLRRTGDMHYQNKPSERSVYRSVLYMISILNHLTQVIQQTLGQQVSQPVAQIVAGFGKVFVGEIVEKGMSPNF